MIEAIQPSGDPSADARRLDEVTNNGRLKDLFTSREQSLRLLLGIRRGRMATDADFASSAQSYPDRTLIRERALAVLNRLLEYYGVANLTPEEFDRLNS